MRALGLVLAVVVITGSGQAWAQEANGCAKFKWSIAREQTAFASPALPIVESGQALPGVMVPAVVKLQPQASVSFEHPPARKPKTAEPYAAVLKMAPIAAAGTYQVTLSDEGWIDVLQDGQEVRSSGFSGQPDCPGVRKSVKFELRPGSPTIQISGASVKTIRVDILPVE